MFLFKKIKIKKNKLYGLCIWSVISICRRFALIFVNISSCMLWKTLKRWTLFSVAYRSLKQGKYVGFERRQQRERFIFVQWTHPLYSTWSRFEFFWNFNICFDGPWSIFPFQAKRKVVFACKYGMHSDDPGPSLVESHWMARRVFCTILFVSNSTPIIREKYAHKRSRFGMKRRYGDGT